MTGKVVIICEQCGKKKYLIPSVAKKQRFCSRSCSSVYGALHSNKEDTDIEIALEKILKDLHIKYAKQYPIPSCRTIPDFFIPAINTAVYADGVYWHSLAWRKRKDIKINNKLIKKGYKVLRFAGDVIKEHPEQVINIIKEATHAN